MRLVKYIFSGSSFFALLLLISIETTAQSAVDNSEFETFEYVDGDTTYLMKKYFLVIYTSGPNRSQTEDETMRLQKEHLAYQGEMGERKKICLAGPMADDGEWRGMLVLSVKDMEAATELVQNDPMVKAGRLKYIIKPWWGAVGTKLF